MTANNHVVDALIKFRRVVTRLHDVLVSELKEKYLPINNTI